MRIRQASLSSRSSRGHASPTEALITAAVLATLAASVPAQRQFDELLPRRGLPADTDFTFAVALVDVDPFMSESDPQGMVIETEPIHVRAGPQRVTAAFLLHSEGPDNDLLKPIDYKLADSNIGSAYGVTTLPHVRDFIITGPFVVTGVSETPSRRRIFTCRPTAPEEERPCARSIISDLGAKAYRRPLTEDDLQAVIDELAAPPADAQARRPAAGDRSVPGTGSRGTACAGSADDVLQHQPVGEHVHRRDGRRHAEPGGPRRLLRARATRGTGQPGRSPSV